MKFCYIDETGTGNEQVTLAVGIVVDAQRMHRSKREWTKLLDRFATIAAKPIDELHTHNLYRGNDQWRNVAAPDRVSVIEDTISWIADRKHRFTFSAIDKHAFAQRKIDGSICQGLSDPLLAAYLHVVLSVQRNFQSQKNHKGHTVLVFDHNRCDQAITQFLHKPPDWADTYYERGKNQERLNSIVDVSFFANSKHAPLIQVADFVAFMLRRYTELQDFGQPESYEGEHERITRWVESLRGSLLPLQHRYLKRGRCPTADMYYQLAPVSLREL